MMNKLLNKAKEEKIDLEIFSTNNNEISIEFLNEKIVNYKIQDIKEYKIKALIDGVAVTSTVLDISDPKLIIDNLKKTRELTDELDKDSLASQIDIDNLDRKKVDVSPIEVKENLKNINIKLKKMFPEIFTIRTEFNFEKDEYEIANTDGVNLNDFNYHSYYSTDIVLKIDNQNLTCEKYVIGKEIDINKFEKELIKAIQNTLAKHNAKSIKTNKYNIILDNKGVYGILSAFSLDFHVQNIIRNQSVFADKLDKKIFNDKINIVEDPTNSELIGTRLFDSEGVKTYYKKIVENGVFITKLYNKKYAEIDSVKSTGNSFGVRNIYITPGEKTEKELIKELKDGIFIEKLSGLHSGINHLTGDISLQCEGFMIENGKKTTPLKHIILSTNIFELFGNVKEVGSNLEFFGSVGGAPSLLIENITIAGKEV